MQTRHRRCAVAELALALGGLWIGLVLLAPCLAGIRSFPPADLLLRAMPWADPALRDDALRFRTNPQLYDGAMHVVPCARMVRESWRAGDVPFRNPAFRFGMPLLGNGQSAPFSPFMLPMWMAPWPQGFAWSALLRVAVLWLGAWLLGRISGLGRAPAAFLCVGTVFVPAILGFMQHPNANVLAMMPMQFAAFEGIVRAADRRAELRWTALLAGTAAVQLLGGHYQPSLCMAVALAVYAAVRVPPRPLGRWARCWGLLAVAHAIGALVAAPAIVPFAEALAGSFTLQLRAETLAGLSHLRANALLHLLDPFALGDYTMPTAMPWKGADRWPEQQQYVGMLVLALAPFGIAAVAHGGERARVAAAWTAVGAFGACMAFGAWPLHDLAGRLPLLGVSRSERFGLLLQWALVALAALGLDGWMASDRGAGGLRSRFAGALVVGCAAALAGVGMWAAVVEQWSSRPFMVGGAALLLVGAFGVVPREWVRWLAAAAALVLALDVAPAWARYFPRPPAGWFRESLRAPAFLPSLPADPEPRVVSVEPLPPNVLALHGVAELRAYDFPMSARHAAFMHHVLESEPDAVERLRLDAVQSDRMARILARCGASAAIIPEWADETLTPDIFAACDSIGETHCLAHFADPAPFASWLPDDAVAATADFDEALLLARDGMAAELETVVVESIDKAPNSKPRPEAAIPATAESMESGNAYRIALPEEARGRRGWLVVRASWDRAWNAFDGNGRRLAVCPAQIKFLAVRTNGDESETILRYRPPAFTAALWCCSAGWLALIAMLAFACRRERPPEPRT